ncbi:MAG TPA: M20 family metallopeptidase [Planctomycetaceae bacterium]|nr:M20 family metallopeptidase [Planctomycetaceae bacterium]
MDSIALLKDLVRIPSVNPMGRDVAGPEFFETRLSEYLVEFFGRLRIDCQRIEVAPGRANVMARIERSGARSTVLLDAHQDTVPTDGMTIDPFDPVVRDGRLFGRGACDVKGGLAAMLAAVARLARERPPGACHVVLSCTCDEEATSLGVNHLVAALRGEAPAYDLIPSPPDAAVVAEPTGLDVVVAHRGATRWKIRTAGRACHSSQPAEGVNAIYRMARVVARLEEYADRLPALVAAHPLCGSATLSVGRIEGGTSVNTVPDWCTIEIDRRVVPGEDGLAARDDVGRFLRERLDFEFEMLPPWIAGQALSDANNGPLADALLGHVAAVAGPRAKVGVPYGTHASRIAAAGVASVVFGPGSIAQAHTKDEWIATDDVERAAEVYYRFCASGGPGRPGLSEGGGGK